MIKPKVNVFQPSSVDTRELSPLQRRLYRVIFQADSVPGRLFDIFLLIAIILSVLVIMLESVKSIYAEYGQILRTLEWIFTGLFTVEYMLRIYCVGKPRKYVFSFFGIIDFFAIIPNLSHFIRNHRPGLKCDSNFALRPHLQYSETGQLCRFWQCYHVCVVCQSPQNRCFSNRYIHFGHFRRRLGIFCRKCEPQFSIHEHTKIDLLGHCNHYHSRFWRYCTHHAHRSISIRVVDDFRLRHHRCAHRYCDRRNSKIQHVAKQSTPRNTLPKM